MQIDRLSKAKNYILRLLSYRAYSKHEILQKLKDKKYSDTVIKEAIADLERVQLINDEEFAEMWVQSRMRVNPRGKNLLIKELSEKGIDRSIIDAVLDSFENDYDETAIAEQLAHKKLKSYGNIDTEKSKRRIYSFLNRRGFSYEAIRKVLDKLY